MCWRPPSTISNWSDGEVRVVGAPQLNVKLGEIARILQGAPGYGFPAGVDPGLEANVNAPHRRAVPMPTPATPPRSRSTSRPAR